MAVVLGHAQEGGHAVFDRLHELAPGDRVTLTDRDGAVLTLDVLGAPLTGLDKSTSALADALNGHPAGAGVALVTCGGELGRQAGASEGDPVVLADRRRPGLTSRSACTPRGGSTRGVVGP